MNLFNLFPFSFSHFLWKFLNFEDSSLFCLGVGLIWPLNNSQGNTVYAGDQRDGIVSFFSSHFKHSQYLAQNARVEEMNCLQFLMFYELLGGRGEKPDNTLLPSYCATPTYAKKLYLTTNIRKSIPLLTNKQGFPRVMAQMLRAGEGFVRSWTLGRVPSVPRSCLWEVRGSSHRNWRICLLCPSLKSLPVSHCHYSFPIPRPEPHMTTQVQHLSSQMAPFFPTFTTALRNSVQLPSLVTFPLYAPYLCRKPLTGFLWECPSHLCCVFPLNLWIVAVSGSFPSLLIAFMGHLPLHVFWHWV